MPVLEISLKFSDWILAGEGITGTFQKQVILPLKVRLVFIFKPIAFLNYSIEHKKTPIHLFELGFFI